MHYFLFSFLFSHLGFKTQMLPPASLPLASP